MAINDYLRTSSLRVNNPFNFKNLKERKRYNDWLKGEGLRTELGHETTNPAGTAIDNPHSRPPSWVQADTGKNHAFFIAPLSSSQHEADVLNAYRSGTTQLEQTAVPASGTDYYAKSNRLVHKIYKLSASALVPGNTTEPEFFEADSGSYSVVVGPESIGGVPGTGIFAIHPTGSYKTYELFVPDYGKIRDIKVWVEILSNVNSAQPQIANLNSLFLGIRSPNVVFKSGLPLWNDERLKNFYEPYGPAGDPKLSGGLFVPYKNTYLLWEGNDDAGLSSWGTDFHIRTVFSDSSKQQNPANLDALYRGDIDRHDPTAQANRLAEGSPNEVFEGAPGSFGGNDVSWISDVRALKEAGVRSKGRGPGSPPKGWLTGNPFIAPYTGDNEFPTTGSNIGPVDILPVYPLLDDITEIIPAFVTGSGEGSSITVRQFGHYRGFRPGLRGTEIHGTWELVISSLGGLLNSLFFRQFRLEIVYEERTGLSKNRSRFERPSLAHSNIANSRRLVIRSGSKNYSGFVAPPFHNQTETPHYENIVVESNNVNQYGATVGILDNTSSLSDNFAVFSRMTGALSDRLTGSDISWYLRNEFGTPFIPLSSGSGDTDELFKTDVEGNKRLVSETLSPQAIIGKDTTANAALRDKNTTKTTRDIAEEKSSEDE